MLNLGRVAFLQQGEDNRVYMNESVVINQATHGTED